MRDLGQPRWLLAATSIVAFGLAACTLSTLKTKYLTEDKASGKASPKTGEYGVQDFFILDVRQLAEVRGASSLTYLGSDERLHYLRVWNKIGHPDEVNWIALRKEACTVVDEQPIDTDEPKFEVKYDPDRRPINRDVKVMGDVCFVPGLLKDEAPGQGHRNVQR